MREIKRHKKKQGQWERKRGKGEGVKGEKEGERVHLHEGF